MHDVNEIAICGEFYKDIKGEINEYEQWEDVASILKVLCKNNHITMVYEDEFHNIFISHEPNDRKYGTPYPFWLSPAEEESIQWDGDESEADLIDV